MPLKKDDFFTVAPDELSAPNGKQIVLRWRLGDKNREDPFWIAKYVTKTLNPEESGVIFVQASRVEDFKKLSFPGDDTLFQVKGNNFRYGWSKDGTKRLLVYSEDKVFFSQARILINAGRDLGANFAPYGDLLGIPGPVYDQGNIMQFYGSDYIKYF